MTTHDYLPQLKRLGDQTENGVVEWVQDSNTTFYFHKLIPETHDHYLIYIDKGGNSKPYYIFRIYDYKASVVRVHILGSSIKKPEQFAALQRIYRAASNNAKKQDISVFDKILGRE